MTVLELDTGLYSRSSQWLSHFALMSTVFLLFSFFPQCVLEQCSAGDHVKIQIVFNSSGVGLEILLF